MAAVLAQPDREPELAGLDMPTLVIHGAEDPLVPPGCGELTAAAIPGATLEIIDGMGHDLPPELFDRFAATIAGFARQAG
jgi:pimeloyl-ACP methyl ester carboxylesterase